MKWNSVCVWLVRKKVVEGGGDREREEKRETKKIRERI